MMILDWRKRAERFTQWRPNLMKFELDSLHRVVIHHQAANALSHQPSTRNCKYFIDKALPMQRRFLFYNKPPLVLLEADVCFKMKQNDLLKIMLVILDGVQPFSVDCLADIQKENSLCSLLVTTIGDTTAQLETYEAGIVCVS